MLDATRKRRPPRRSEQPRDEPTRDQRASDTHGHSHHVVDQTELDAVQKAAGESPHETAGDIAEQRGNEDDDEGQQRSPGAVGDPRGD